MKTLTTASFTSGIKPLCKIHTQVQFTLFLIVSMSSNTFSNLITLAGDDPDTYSNGGRAIYEPGVEELLAMSTLLLQGIKSRKNGVVRSVNSCVDYNVSATSKSKGTTALPE